MIETILETSTFKTYYKIVSHEKSKINSFYKHKITIFNFLNV